MFCYFFGGNCISSHPQISSTIVEAENEATYVVNSNPWINMTSKYLDLTDVQMSFDIMVRGCEWPKNSILNALVSPQGQTFVLSGSDELWYLQSIWLMIDINTHRSVSWWCFEMGYAICLQFWTKVNSPGGEYSLKNCMDLSGRTNFSARPAWSRRFKFYSVCYND